MVQVDQRTTLVIAVVAVMIVCGVTVSFQPTQSVSIVGLGTIIVVAMVNLLQQTKINEAVQATKDLGEATHTLVNSNMGTQLLMNATDKQRIADLTQDPKDIETARVAKEAYEQHMSQQAVIDSGATTPLAAKSRTQTPMPQVPDAKPLVPDNQLVDVEHLQPNAVQQITTAAKPQIIEALKPAIKDAMKDNDAKSQT